MVSLLAFATTALATVFFEHLLVRWTQRRQTHTGAWATALALFALASAAFAIGASTGWDAGTFRAFYLFGAVLNVPWLAFGTVALLAPRAAPRVRTGLLLFSGLAVGVVLAAPMRGSIAAQGIPEGREVFDAFPRILAAVGSGVGALVVLVGAVWSAWRYLSGQDANRRRVGSNLLIALAVIILSGGGIVEGLAGGEDEAFALSLAVGTAVLYLGFRFATGSDVQVSSRRSNFPANPRGNASTKSTVEGAL